MGMDSIDVGALAGRPAPRTSTEGKFYLADDTDELFIQNDMTWVLVGAGGVAAAAAAQADADAAQASIDNHVADGSDAHDASAISILDTANDFAATDVEGALAELQSDHEADAASLTGHTTNPTGAHASTAISYDATLSQLQVTTVKAALDALAIRPYAWVKVVATAPENIPSGTAVFFNNRVKTNPSSMWVGANGQQLIVPTSGYYEVDSLIQISDVDSAAIDIIGEIRVNGVVPATPILSLAIVNPNDPTLRHLRVSGPLNLVFNDIVTLHLLTGANVGGVDIDIGSWITLKKDLTTV